MDIASSEKKSVGGNKCAQVSLDFETNCMHAGSPKKRSHTAEDMLKFIDKMVGMGKDPQNFMRPDRSGENLKMWHHF